MYFCLNERIIILYDDFPQLRRKNITKRRRACPQFFILHLLKILSGFVISSVGSSLFHHQVFDETDSNGLVKDSALK